jgi:ABC-type sugar transport system ATPase subunit
MRGQRSTVRTTGTKNVVLRIEDLTKTFPGGNKALDDFDLDIYAGEVHALIGQNGSGKSTLVKILSGYHAPDHGMRLTVNGDLVSIAEFERDQRRDVPLLSFLHQDLGLVLELNTIENLGLHCGFRFSGIRGINWKRQAEWTREVMRPLAPNLDLYEPLSEAKPVQRTMVALAAATQMWNHEDNCVGRVLVLDEPTATLPPEEVDQLFSVIQDFKASGAGILFVSHRLDEVFEIADRVTVLRNGVKIATRAVQELSKSELVSMMVGSKIAVSYRSSWLGEQSTEPLLEVKGIVSQMLRGVDITLNRGEVVGLTGMPDSGHEELPLILAGVRPADAGQLRMKAVQPDWINAEDWDSHRIGLVPADRLRDGIISAMNVTENLSLSSLSRLRSKGRLSRPRERSLVQQWIDVLALVPRDPTNPAPNLSGGNQQKLVIGRALAASPEALMLCEPTAGVDIAARHAIYDLIVEEARNGIGMLVVSSDIGDLTAICNRVVVLADGLVTNELRDDEITESNLLHAMQGINRGSSK